MEFMLSDERLQAENTQLGTEAVKQQRDRGVTTNRRGKPVKLDKKARR